MYTDEYKRQGVALLEAHGVPYPAVFSDPIREYNALVGGAALIDLSHWGVVRLRGSDRVAFLHSQITGDVAALEPNRARRAALTTTKGKLVAELFVLARQEELLVLVAQGGASAVAESLEKHIIADDVELEDVSASHAVLSVEGPRCRDVVWRVFPESVPPEALAFRDAGYQGMPATILRNATTGGPGFQLILSGEGARVVRDYVLQAGQGFDLERCGYVAWNTRRVEVGEPWWGLDVGDNFPKECRLDDLVDYEKGCFLGQETLARMRYRGHPNWLLVGLQVSGRSPSALQPPAEPGDAEAYRLERFAGAELFRPGESPAEGAAAVGRLTSPVFSPATGRFLSLGSVRHTMADPGTRFELVLDDEPVEIEVVTLPVETKES